jgi:hypothetical protein
VYNALKYELERKRMANFMEKEWNGYRIKLWPGDHFRKEIAARGLEAAILYYDSTYISFDLRISRLNDKKIIEDTIKYEWWLCRQNKPISPPEDGSFFFIKPKGDGTFPFSTIKRKGKLPKSADIIPVKYGKFVGNRKIGAIDIGRIGELDRYTVVMQFTTSSGVISPPLELVSFTIFDRDVFIRYYLLSALAILTATFIGIILKGCGIA